MDRIKLLLASTAIAAAAALPAAAQDSGADFEVGVEDGNNGRVTNLKIGQRDGPTSLGEASTSPWDDSDFVVTADSPMAGKTIVSTDGATIGRVVETRQTSDGTTRLFVQLEPGLSEQAQRIVLTMPPGAQLPASNGEIQLGLTRTQLSDSLGAAFN